MVYIVAIIRQTEIIVPCIYMSLRRIEGSVSVIKVEKGGGGGVGGGGFSHM